MIDFLFCVCFVSGCFKNRLIAIGDEPPAVVGFGFPFHMIISTSNEISEFGYGASACNNLNFEVL